MVVEAKGLLFDMDGVLVSSIGSVNRCWKKWAEHYGVVDAEKVQIAHGTRAVDIIKLLVPGLDVAEGLKLIEDMEMEDVADLDVLAGAKELLESLPAERWAIVTSATKRLAIARLGVAGLPVPERFITGDMVEKGKPDPEPYRRGAELLGFAAAECIVVEDAPSGVGAGVAAGCRVLGVLGTHSAEELRAAGVSWVVGSLAGVTARMDGGGLRIELQVV
jgi:sugar-phosphatase